MPSSPAVTTEAPSEDQAIALIQPKSCPVSNRVTSPVATSISTSGGMLVPTARVRPSGENARVATWSAGSFQPASGYLSSHAWWSCDGPRRNVARSHGAAEIDEPDDAIFQANRERRVIRAKVDRLSSIGFRRAAD